MENYLFGFVVVLLVVAAFAVRRLYGLEAAEELLPFLIAGPCAYVLLKVVRLVWRLQLKAKTRTARAQDIYAGILLAAWIVCLGLSPFQHWMTSTKWELLATFLMLALILVPRLIHNRLTLGTWMAKRSPSKQPTDQPNRHQ
jgi:hypothetical protein